MDMSQLTQQNPYILHLKENGIKCLRTNRHETLFLYIESITYTRPKYYIIARKYNILNRGGNFNLFTNKF